MSDTEGLHGAPVSPSQRSLSPSPTNGKAWIRQFFLLILVFTVTPISVVVVAVHGLIFPKSRNVTCQIFVF